MRKTTLFLIAAALCQAWPPAPARSAEFDALIAALAAPDAAVRAEAAWTLGDAGHEAKAAMPALAEASADPVAEVRVASIAAMERIAAFANVAVPVMIAALDDPDAQVRYVAAGALGQFSLKARDIVPALIDSLRDPDPAVAAAAGNGLTRMGTRAVRPLVGALRDDGAGVRAAAAGALGGIRVRARPALPALIEAAIDRSPAVRAAAVRAIGLIASAEEATRRHDSTTEFAETGQFPRANWAARRMARVSSIRREMAALVTPALLEALEDRHEPVRHAAVRALADIGVAAHAASGAIAAMVGDSSPRVRRGAAAALGRVVSPDRAAAPLSALLADEELTVRWAAARALAGFGAETHGRLAEALASGDAAVRAAAAVGLGEPNADPARAAALLEQARRDEDPGVRAAAEAALIRIAAADRR